MSTITPLLAIVLALASCGNKAESQPGPDNKPEEKPQQQYATAYITTGNQSSLFEKKQIPLQSFLEPSQASYAAEIDDKTQYQEIDGFGAALTGASCYNLLKMKPELRTALLKELFDPEEGLGLSLARVSIGASDFSVDEEFTWCDSPGLENFAIHKEDRDYLIPILHEVYEINPGLKLIASPWSAPKWMKNSADANPAKWNNGTLKPECYETYAQYFVKWIQAMKAEGFDIYAMTIQNEPLNRGNSMSMYMSWQEQRDFIKDALGPAFEKAGIDTKILVFDHNYNYDGIASQKDYPLNIYNDPDAARYVAGSAWHNYGGSPSVLAGIHSSAPEKDIYFTEASIGTWNYNFLSCLIIDFRDIFIQTMSNYSKGVTLWNLMLDENRGPYRPGGCSTCFGVVTLNSSGGTVASRQSHYYNLAHASKVIKPGAVRIKTSGYKPTGVNYLAFRNPDGSTAVIIVNENPKEQTVHFKCNGKVISCGIAGLSIESLIWE
ncbi:MAG: glycoside hydrolase family 30 beta sandwich domain-containing protein [Candidatus Cryptobacteroides sp.]